MFRQSFTFILLLSVISSIYSQSFADMFNYLCDKSMQTIKADTFAKSIKEMQECREKAIPKDLLVGLNKCEEGLPLLTAEQVTKACSNKDANLAKIVQQWECKDKTFSKNLNYTHVLQYSLVLAYAECSWIKGFY